MKRIITILAALSAALMMLVSVPSSPAQASAGAYTYVQDTSDVNKRILVRCHVPAGEWRTLFRGDNSKQVCGSNGWVEAIWAPDGGSLYALNLNTGNETAYGYHYKGSIGGGSYYVYLLCFPQGVC